MSEQPSTTVRLDVFDFEESVRFYHALGFETALVRDEGRAVETRELRSPRFPGFALEFACCFPKPVIGSSRGAFRQLRFAVGDLRAALASLGAVTFVHVIDEGATTATLLDPNGYQIELVQAD